MKSSRVLFAVVAIASLIAGAKLIQATGISYQPTVVAGSGGGAAGNIGDVVTTASQTLSGLNTFTNRVLFSSSIFTNGAAQNDAANVVMGSQFAYLKNGNIGLGTITPLGDFEFFTPNDMSAIFRRNTELSQGAINLWFLTGTGVQAVTNTLGGIRFETTQADPSPLRGDMEFYTNVGDNVREVARISGNGRFGVGTSTPGAVVHASSGTGGTGPIFIASTKTAAGVQTNLFEVNASSIVATAVPVTVSSLTVLNGGVSMVGTGPAQFLANGEIQLDANGDGTKEIGVNGTSVTLKDGMFISLRDKDRFTTPAFGSGTFITYIATPTMGISSSTLGTFQFSAAISSQANFCVFPWFVPDDIDLTAPISVSSFGIVLGAGDTNSQVYQVSIATTQSGSLVLETRFSGSGAWTSSMTIVIPADATGAAGDLETSTGTIVWGGIQNTLIPGTLHYIIVSRDGDHGSDASTVNSYSSFFVISYKRRFYQ